MNDDLQAVRREEVHLYVHLDPLKVSITPERRPGAPVTAILTIGGSLLPAQISIDDTAGAVDIVWVDDKGDTDAPRPDGAQVTFASDNTAVVTVTPDPNNPDAASLTPVAEGTANVSATITDASGNPLLEPDGVTPFAVQPAPVQVIAGAAVGAGLQIKS